MTVTLKPGILWISSIPEGDIVNYFCWSSRWSSSGGSPGVLLEFELELLLEFFWSSSGVAFWRSAGVLSRKIQFNVNKSRKSAFFEVFDILTWLSLVKSAPDAFFIFEIWFFFLKNSILTVTIVHFILFIMECYQIDPSLKNCTWTMNFIFYFQWGKNRVLVANEYSNNEDCQTGGYIWQLRSYKPRVLLI